MSNRLRNTGEGKCPSHGGTTVVGYRSGSLARPGDVLRTRRRKRAVSLQDTRRATRQSSASRRASSAPPEHLSRPGGWRCLRSVTAKDAIRARGDKGDPYDSAHESLLHKDWWPRGLMEEITGSRAWNRQPADASEHLETGPTTVSGWWQAWGLAPSRLSVVIPGSRVPAGGSVFFIRIQGVTNPYL